MAGPKPYKPWGWMLGKRHSTDCFCCTLTSGICVRIQLVLGFTGLMNWEGLEQFGTLTEGWKDTSLSYRRSHCSSL